MEATEIVTRALGTVGKPRDGDQGAGHSLSTGFVEERTESADELWESCPKTPEGHSAVCGDDPPCLSLFSSGMSAEVTLLYTQEGN